MTSTTAAAIVGRLEPQQSFDAWNIAKARFLDGLDEGEKTLFTEANIENVFYKASNIEREDQKDSKTRSLLQNIQPLISAVEDYGKALDKYSNIASLYIAPIWGSIRVVLVIASSHGRFYDRIVDTFGRIGDILPRFRGLYTSFSLVLALAGLLTLVQVTIREFSMAKNISALHRSYRKHISILSLFVQNSEHCCVSRKSRL